MGTDDFKILTADYEPAGLDGLCIILQVESVSPEGESEAPAPVDSVLRAIFRPGDNAEEDTEKVFQLGAIDTITKPFSYMNHTVPVASAYSRGKLLKNGLALILSPGDFERFNKECTVVPLGETTISFETILATKNSGKYDFAFSVFAMKTRGGEIRVGVLGKNITELKRAERDLLAVKEQAGCAPAEEVKPPQRILFNLMSNTAKLTRRNGEIKLLTGMTYYDGKECRTRFEIKDSGAGINSESHGRLREVFEQGDNSVARAYGRMGQGLPLTKRTANMMKGSLRVQSESGKASGFIREVFLGVGPALHEPEICAEENWKVNGDG